MYSLLVVAWIQFQINDWVRHGPNSKDPSDSIQIPLSSDDPLYNPFGPSEQYMSIDGTTKDPTYGDQPEDINRPQTFNNLETAWWDANQLYGTDYDTNQRLRDPTDPAKFKLDFNADYNEYRLPWDENGEIVGNNDNWWLGLSLMHNLFTLEHNHIIDELRGYYGVDAYPNDELFEIGRLIISALIAKIHTIEWTTAALNNDVGDIGLRTNWYGFEFAWFQTLYDGIYLDTSQYQLISTIQQIVRADPVKGGSKNLYGANYQFTEEFVSIYRWHALFPDRRIVGRRSPRSQP